MALDVPVRMRVLWIIIVGTGDFNLLEAPLRENTIRCTQVTSQVLVTEPHLRRQRMDLVYNFTLLDIAHDFDDPVVRSVADGCVAVTRYFVRQLRHRSGGYCASVDCE